MLAIIIKILFILFLKKERKKVGEDFSIVVIIIKMSVIFINFTHYKKERVHKKQTLVE